MINLNSIPSQFILRSTQIEPKEVQIVSSYVKDKVDGLLNEFLDSQRKQRKDLERFQSLEDLDVEKPLDERQELINVFIEPDDVLDDFQTLPKFWSYKDKDPDKVSNKTDPITLSLVDLESSFSALEFPKKFLSEAISYLQIGTFSLFFEGVSFDQAEIYYPVFKSIQQSNDFILLTYQEDSIDKADINTLIAIADEKTNVYKDDIILKDIIKVRWYNYLLERVGQIPFPETPEIAPQDTNSTLTKTYLEKELSMGRLVALGIVESGEEKEKGKMSVPFLTNFEKARLIGERAKEIAKNARIMTDPGDLIDPIKIAEKELDELRIPTNVCRRFPDGTTELWCASSLASSRDVFYDYVLKILNSLTLPNIYATGVKLGYGTGLKRVLIDTYIQFNISVSENIEHIQVLSEDMLQVIEDNISMFFDQTQLSRNDKDFFTTSTMRMLSSLETKPSIVRVLAKDIVVYLISDSEIYDKVKYSPKVGFSYQAQPIDAPRKLTKDEIQDIVESVPHIPSVISLQSKVARKSMINKMKDRLKAVELCPSAIPSLKQSIKTQYLKSRIDAGSTVGNTAADALGEQVSQMTLNSFHVSGASKNMSSGIKALGDLIYAHDISKGDNQSCDISFKDPITFDQALDLKGDIIETTMGELVLDYEIDYTENLEQKWWTPFFPLPEDTEDNHVKIMRLKLDATFLTQRGITMEQIRNSLMGSDSVAGIPPSSVFIAHGPIKEAIVDIYPNVKVIKDSVDKIHVDILKETKSSTAYRVQYTAETFLSLILLENLDKIHVKGISGIKDAYPEKNPVWSIVDLYEHPSPNDDFGVDFEEYDIETLWVLYYDTLKLRYSSVSHTSLIALLMELGYEILYQDPTKSLIRNPKEVTKDPKNYISKVMSDIKDKRKELQEERQNVEDDPEYERDQVILDLEHYIRIITEGFNLTGILENPAVDPDHTFCNNIHYVTKIYGVEAARQLFVKELYDKFTSYDGYVNPRNILLLADFLFRYGTYLGTTYSKMRFGNMGYFTRATFERSSYVLEESAAFAKEENMTSVAAAIAVGKPPILGTGYFDIQSNPTFEDEEGNVIQSTTASAEKTIEEHFNTDVDIFEQFDEDIPDIGINKDKIEKENPNTTEDSNNFVDDFLEREAPQIEKTKKKKEEPQTSQIKYQSVKSKECPQNVEEGASEMLQIVEDNLEDLPEKKIDIASQEMQSITSEIPSEVKQAPIGSEEQQPEELKLIVRLPILKPF